jgi:predicted metal-dependent peptidase
LQIELKEESELQEESELKAIIDELTGAFNRRYYETKLEEELKQLGELLDEHVDWGKDPGEDGESGPGSEANGDGGDGDGQGRPTYSNEELKKIRDEIKENMISAAQSAGAGNVPKGVERMLKELTEPKMNWREILRQQIQSTIRLNCLWRKESNLICST